MSGLSRSVTAAPRPLRADAARNRLRILDAAQEVFASRGLDVPLDDIATHANLGVGTVYRRFPDRESLVEALFDRRMQRQVELVRAALADPDPWHGLEGVLRATCCELAHDRGMRQVLLSSEYGQQSVDRARQELVGLLEQLVDRAQVSGQLRPDFHVSDIPVLFLMVGVVADFSGEVAPELWQRHYALLLAGLRSRADPAAPPVQPGLGEDDMLRAMAGWRPARRPTQV